MFVKKFLGGLLVVGALVAIPAAASAYEPYHYHHHYYPTYYPPVYVPRAPVVYTAPQIVYSPPPVVVTPIIISIDVFYRGDPSLPWTLYNTYSSRYDADSAARSLEISGYQSLVRVR
jgi:hypothetical protein